MKISWQNSVAVITGGGSGIGRALAKAMAKRGTTVVITDINGESATAVARECGEKAASFQLDVRDANAVKELIHTVYTTYGRLNFMFNNAGIGASGEVYEIPAEFWDRIIDINIKGVVNGVLAAYPLMVKQGSGHIINTASLAGLGAAPLLAPYSMTKHAVVGLSASLRIEAAVHGVNVNVLCPGTIETPILDSTIPEDLPSVAWMPDTRRYLASMAGAPYPADKLAEEALRNIEQNKAVIVIPGKARIAWKMGRFFPALVEKLGLKAVKAERAYRK